jgi:hypothetical protein
MTSKKRSRYFSSKIVPIIDGETIKPYVTPRVGFSSDDLPQGCMSHVLKPQETLKDVSKLYYGTTDAWFLLAELNDIPNPFDLRSSQEGSMVRIAVPPWNFISRYL